MTRDRRHRWLVFLAFALVYVFWGSTYLAIGIAVERIPPLVVCALRFSVAGSLMLGFCAATGRNVLYSFRELARYALVGNLLLTGGNLTLAFAEQYVPTGLAALIVASTPLFFLVLDAWIVDTHHLSGRDFFGLGLGIVGLVVLLWPNLTATGALGKKETWLVACRLDSPRSRRSHLPCDLRIVGRIHRLRVVAAERTGVEGFHLRVCKSSDRSLSGLAGLT
jgi:drug/metabolite transporter (DMT)-like permease